MNNFDDNNNNGNTQLNYQQRHHMNQKQGAGRGFRGGMMGGRSRGRFKNRTKWDNRGVHFQEQGQGPEDASYPGQGRGQGGRGKGIRTRLGPGLKVTTGQGNRRIVQNARLGGPGASEGHDWFRVVIPFGAKYDKEWLVNALRENTGPEFKPINLQSGERESIVFQTQGFEMAETLKSLSKRIPTPQGFKLTLIVTPSTAPQTPLNEQTRIQMREVMSRRYNIEIKALDLSSFKDDPMLEQQGLFMPLSRKIMIDHAVKIITENIPDLVFLSLSNNNLRTLEALRPLAENCGMLKCLDLSKNKIENLAELDHVKDLYLDELILAENPVVKKFKDNTTYVSQLRSLFPKLNKLDGTELPAAIGFDSGSNEVAPPTLPSYIPEENKTFVTGFIEQYFKIFDSNDRQGLLAGYHDQASFSYAISRTDQKSPLFTDNLLKESRNLTKIKDSTHAMKLLKQGKVNIVSTLCNLPKTIHELESFQVDVPICHPNFIQVVINGVFRELSRTPAATRAFSRSFIIVPQGEGFVIINDMLLLTNATVKQISEWRNRGVGAHNKINARDSNMEEFGMPSTSRGGGGGSMRPMPVATSPPMGGGSGGGDARTEEMITLLAMKTGMNRGFSAQCLQETNGDLNKALEIFNQLNALGKIPSEAFIAS